MATVNSKQAWPDWYPPKEMIARQPALARSVSKLQSGLGVPGGPRNPLGARALYLWQNNKDTLYRIHGTTEPESIGRSVSSGCIRMINQDAIDLYVRVPVGGAGGGAGLSPADGPGRLSPPRDEASCSYCGGWTFGLGIACAVAGSARIALTVGTAAAAATRPVLRRA